MNATVMHHDATSLMAEACFGRGDQCQWIMLMVSDKTGGDSSMSLFSSIPGLLGLLDGLEESIAEAREALLIARDKGWTPGEHDRVFRGNLCALNFSYTPADPATGVSESVDFSHIRTLENTPQGQIWRDGGLLLAGSQAEGRWAKRVLAAMRAEEVESAGLDMVDLAASVCGMKPLDGGAEVDGR